MSDNDTVIRLLDAAEKCCRTRGYNAFSFRDLAEEVGIRSASIHYHFPTKGDLGKALVVRYRQQHEQFLLQVERQENNPRKRLEKFVDAMRLALKNDGQACLCGMFAAESSTLPQEVRDEVTQFFRLIEGWIERQLKDGQKKGIFRFSGDASQVAGAILGALQGMMLTARAMNQESRLTRNTDWLITQLCA